METCDFITLNNIQISPLKIKMFTWLLNLWKFEGFNKIPDKGGMWKSERSAGQVPVNIQRYCAN